MIFDNKIISAPMAGVSDSVFRLVCREHGADAVVSEMISAEGILHGSGATLDLLRFVPGERPIGVQLFGADPRRLAEAAAFVEERVAPDFIDLNAGCPVRKVVQRNGGAALLKDQKLFEAIVDAMVRAATRTPITVKIRSGWSLTDRVDVAFARIAQECGAAAVTLHPRSKTMGFAGQALWDRIAAVRQAITIPVIGNGDIVRPEDAREMMEQTGCNGVMIGRGALGNPWLFGQCRAVLDGRPAARVSRHECIAAALRHIALYRERHGETRAAAEMKKHCAWYVRGMSGAAGLRKKIFTAGSTIELEKILSDFYTG